MLTDLGYEQIDILDCDIELGILLEVLLDQVLCKEVSGVEVAPHHTQCNLYLRIHTQILPEDRNVISLHGSYDIVL